MYKLSPSDFGYLWNDCKHCYYQKVKNGVAQPGIFPSMFTHINKLLQDSIMGINLQDISTDLPSGIVEVQEGFLRSKPIPGASDCFVSGRFDILSRLEDGSYCIIDFKITTTDEEKIQKYSNQLHAYKFALENPADINKKPVKISKLGVVSVHPEEMHYEDGKIIFTTNPKFHPIREDMESFFKLVKQISEVLNGDLPNVSENCNLCIYRSRFAPKSEVLVDEIPF